MKKKQKILKMLWDGMVHSNSELSTVALRYGGFLHQLRHDHNLKIETIGTVEGIRAAGYNTDTFKVKDGFRLYRLLTPSSLIDPNTCNRLKVGQGELL